MKRRHFAVITSFAIVNLIAPLNSCISDNPKSTALLSDPKILLNIMENDEIKDLGREYLRKNPKENEKDVLAILIYDDYPNKISNSKLNSLIKDKIKSDFETQNIVTLNGWILSITEARQCALFSLN